LVEGTYQWQDLFAAHNEHRVFTGRILALALFFLNGRILDAMVEMAANAVLHAGALLVLLYGLERLLPTRQLKLSFFLLAAIFLSVPYGWENILTNNSSFYFVMLFSFVFLWALAYGNTGSPGWYLLVLGSGMLSYLSFASGVLTLVAGIGFLGIQWITGVQRNRSMVIMMVLLALLTVAAIHFTPVIAGHDHYKSRSILDFVVSLMRITGGFLLYIPSILFVLRQLRQRPAYGDPSWFLFALCIWISSQIVVICYGRGHGNVLASRYLDLFAIGLLINLVSLLVLMHERTTTFNTRGLQAWLMAVFLGCGFFLPGIAGNLEKMRVDGIEQARRVRAYLETKDYGYLQSNNEKNIPYPDPLRLKTLLDNKTIQSILPRTLTSPDVSLSGNSSGKFVRSTFAVGAVLIGIGTGLFFILLLQKNQNEDDCRG
jgi:hypothetical protein